MEQHGRTALILVDGEVIPEGSGIPIMPGGAERHRRTLQILATARAAGIAPIFIREVHKRSLVDFGRELDGVEAIHCLEGELATELTAGLEPRPDEYLIRKRRYSAFFATELDRVLRSYGAQTLVLLGALTDVCVHYTFADAHQHDYHCRVVTDCVGGSTMTTHEASLQAMRYLQRDCLVSSDEVLAALGKLSALGAAA